MLYEPLDEVVEGTEGGSEVRKSFDYLGDDGEQTEIWLHVFLDLGLQQLENS